MKVWGQRGKEPEPTGHERNGRGGRQRARAGPGLARRADKQKGAVRSPPSVYLTGLSLVTTGGRAVLPGDAAVFDAFALVISLNPVLQ